MAEEKTTYINAPFRDSVAKKVKRAAAKAKRSVGKQVAWIVERFMEER